MTSFLYLNGCVEIKINAKGGRRRENRTEGYGLLQMKPPLKGAQLLAFYEKKEKEEEREISDRSITKRSLEIRTHLRSPDRFELALAFVLESDDVNEAEFDV